MKTYIKVKNQFEGIHCYKNAPESASFLRSPHRHIFYVTTKISVTHDDRELEFFIVKHRIIELLSEVVNELGINMSCEQIAKSLITKLQSIYGNRYYQVEVSEDNENSAVVEV